MSDTPTPPPSPADLQAAYAAQRAAWTTPLLDAAEPVGERGDE